MKKVLTDAQSGSLVQVEAEIRQEKAESLGRIGERLEQVSGKLLALKDELAAFASPYAEPSVGPNAARQDMAERLAVWKKLQTVAEDLRYALIVQREACGLWRHEDVDRHYPIPSLPDILTSGDPKEVP